MVVDRTSRRLLERRTDTVIERDGVEIARTHHRHVVAPGDDVSTAHPLVQRTARAEHTPAVVRAYRDAQATKEALTSILPLDFNFV